MAKNSNKCMGVVKWFDDKKGYGFITQNNGEDIFVHYTGIDGSGHRALEKGDVVEFYIEQSRRTDRDNAVMVTVTQPAPVQTRGV